MMSTRTPPSALDIAQVLGRGLRAPMDLQTYRNLLYVLSMFVLGTFYFNLIVAGVATALPLVFVGIGALLLVALLVVVVELAGFERLLVRRLLAVDLPEPPAEADDTRWNRTKRLVTDLRTWKAVTYLLTEFVYGTAAFALVAPVLVTAVSFLTAPFYYTRAPVTAYGPIPASTFTLDVLFGWDTLLVGLEATFQFGSWRIETLFGAFLVAGVGAVLLFVGFVLSNVAAQLWGRYARQMLVTPRYWTRPGW